MNKDKVKEIYKMLCKSKYSDVIGALLLFEYENYNDVLQLNDQKMKQLKATYDWYIDSDVCGFICEEIKDVYEKNRGR